MIQKNDTIPGTELREEQSEQLFSGEELLREKIKQYLPKDEPEAQNDQHELSFTAPVSPRQSEPEIPAAVAEPEENSTVDTPQGEDTASYTNPERFSFLHRSFFDSSAIEDEENKSTDDSPLSEPASYDDENPAVDRISGIPAADSDSDRREEAVDELVKKEIEWYDRQCNTEKERLKEIQSQRLKLEEQVRQEEEDLKKEISDIDRRKRDEKLKLRQVQESRLKSEEKYHQQERQLRRSIEELEMNKFKEIKAIDGLEQRKKREEAMLRKMDEFLRSEMEVIDKRIDSENEKLNTLKLHTLNAKEKLKEFEQILEQKKSEVAEHKEENAKIIRSLCDEMKRTELDAETFRSKVNTEIGSIVERRNELQDQMEKHRRDFDVFKKATIGEKNRLEQELARLSQYREDERTMLYSLKEEKVNLEKEIARAQQAFAAVTDELRKTKEAFELQLAQQKERYAHEAALFNEKKKDYLEQEQTLLYEINCKKEELKQVLNAISLKQEDFDAQKTQLKFEIDEINQEKEFAQSSLRELNKTIDDSRLASEEQEEKLKERISQLSAQIEQEELKLAEKRTMYLEEQRLLELKLSQMGKRAKRIKEAQKSVIHKLNTEKVNVKNQIDQIRQKHETASVELEVAKTQHEVLLREIDDIQRKKDRESLALQDELEQIKREIGRYQDLRDREAEELEKITNKRQSAEEEYQARMRKLESEIDMLAQARLEHKLHTR